MSTLYHVASPDGTRHGEMSEDDIKAKLRTGELNEDCLIWAEGWADWRPVSTLLPTPDWGFYTAMETVYLWRYTDFHGRASRAEYWYCKIGTFAGLLLVGIIGGATELLISRGHAMMLTQGLLGLLVLLIIVPNVALAVRRLHDIGMSGWWYLATFLPMGDLFMLIISLLPSGGPNRWGRRPDAPAAE